LTAAELLDREWALEARYVSAHPAFERPDIEPEPLDHRHRADEILRIAHGPATPDFVLSP
jgi:hypothetical protein